MDAQEIEHLYDRYGHVVYGRCLRLLGSSADAEEALQEVFLRAMKSAKGFRHEASPLTWLTKIATNHCLNVLRTRRRRMHSSHVDIDDVKEIDLAGSYRAGSPEAASIVRSVLELFPREVQEMAVYYFVDGMTQEEVAQVTGVSLPTLRKRLNGFVEKARDHLEKAAAATTVGGD